MSGSQERSEKPTGKKLTDARKRGKIARSKELTSVAVLLGGGTALSLSSGIIYTHFKMLIEELWGQGFASALQATPDVNLAIRLMSHLGIMILPTVMVAAVMAVAVCLFQTGGFMLSWETIQPDFSKLNPLQGIKRLVTTRSFIELGKSTIKLLIISYAVYGVIKSDQDFCMTLINRQIIDIVSAFGALAIKIFIRVSTIMLLLSLMDYGYQRWQHQKDLRMTKQEVKEEHKQSEGNPQIKSRIRTIQRSLARKRMMSNVPKASMVVTNPTHYAVALLYTPEMEAPKVVAKGMDFLAQNIIKLARKHGVPVVQNPPLARALYSQVNVEETIPVALYKAVAKLLAYIYQRRRAKPA